MAKAKPTEVQTEVQAPAPEAVVSETQSVTETAPVVVETPVEVPAVVEAPVAPTVLPAGVLMESPAVSDNGVAPGTSVTLANGTVITHN